MAALLCKGGWGERGMESKYNIRLFLFKVYFFQSFFIKIVKGSGSYAGEGRGGLTCFVLSIKSQENFSQISGCCRYPTNTACFLGAQRFEPALFALDVPATNVDHRTFQQVHALGALV